MTSQIDETPQADTSEGKYFSDTIPSSQNRSLNFLVELEKNREIEEKESGQRWSTSVTAWGEAQVLMKSNVIEARTPSQGVDRPIIFESSNGL